MSSTIALRRTQRGTPAASRRRLQLPFLPQPHACGCDAVYFEGMNTEQDYGGLRVINPFAGSWR